ncbi:MAG: GNAT family N-acetyltransferase, partial [Candidatus Altiarchaeales archaeon]|nr:GNAT family N-acetyltransferase [Candidatus Altiarchaeales archaeon]
FYNFIYKERDYGYLAAFDPSPVYSRYSIGMLMINHGVERAIKQECREFDLGRGVDKYKMRYATDVNESVSVRIGRKNPKGILMTSILDVGSSLKNFMIWILPEEIINKIKGRVIDTDLSVFK